MTLPLKWSHAANSLEKISNSAEDRSITAVECDVMLGVANESGTQFYETPILAHPPHRESDISVATLLLRMTKVQDQRGGRILKKHLKLDFKEISAVEPSLELLKTAKLSNDLGKTIFLNADVLVGPGRRNDPPVPPSAFLNSCLKHIRSSKVSQLLQKRLVPLGHCKSISAVVSPNNRIRTYSTLFPWGINAIGLVASHTRRRTWLEWQNWLTSTS